MDLFDESRRRKSYQEPDRSVPTKRPREISRERTLNRSTSQETRLKVQ